MQIGKTYSFEAAHWLPGHPKCGKMHGHSYRFEVIIEGLIDERGVIFDFHELGSLVKPIIDELDHTTLNDTLFNFKNNKGLIPSADNIALYIFKKLSAQLPLHLNLVSIKLWETADAWAIAQKGDLSYEGQIRSNTHL